MKWPWQWTSADVEVAKARRRRDAALAAIRDLEAIAPRLPITAAGKSYFPNSCVLIEPSTRDLLTAIEALSQQLTRIEDTQERLMPTIDDLQADMDAIKSLVQKQTDLIAQLTAGSGTIPADVQAKIDALDAEAKTILGTPAT